MYILRITFWIVAGSFLTITPWLTKAETKDSLSESQAEKQTAEKQALDSLKADWLQFLAKPAPAPSAIQPFAGEEAFLPLPQRKSVAVQAFRTFQEPEEIRSVNGALHATLWVTKARNWIGDDPVYLRSYNGHLVGPTLRAKPGDTLCIDLINDLESEDQTEAHNTFQGWNTTNLHTHGLHVSPSGRSDNVLLEIPPGSRMSYEIKIPKNHPCGTFWYHAHKHGSVAAQVSSGMSGALIIEGGLDNVAAIAAARERVLVLQQIPYWNDGLKEGVIELKYADKIFGPGAWQSLPRFTTVNGVQLPVFRMRAKSVERWRLIHSGVREQIALKLLSSQPDQHGQTIQLPLYEIAADGIPLGKLVKIDKDAVVLYPGYRWDVLVQAPDSPGEYLLVDEAAPAELTINAIPKPRLYCENRGGR
jgi:FtsP/CotA-like multicopper oxidase with cupredoxin domain